MALIQCKECGGMISDRAKSCPKCGCSVIKEKPKSICPECGIEVSDNDEKCPNCGVPFSHLEENNRLLGSLSDIKEDKHEEICVCPHCGWRYKRGTAETCPICKADLREAQDYDRQQNFVYSPSVLDRIFDFVLDYWYLCVSVVVGLLIWGYYSWDNQSSTSHSDEFFQEGYIYTAQATHYNVFKEPIPTSYTLIIYYDGSITLNEKTPRTDITYHCTLRKYSESLRDKLATWYQLEGKEIGKATTLYFDTFGHCYFPLGRNGHEAIVSGKYDFTLSKKRLERRLD